MSPPPVRYGPEALEGSTYDISSPDPKTRVESYIQAYHSDEGAASYFEVERSTFELNHAHLHRVA